MTFNRFRFALAATTIGVIVLWGTWLHGQRRSAIGEFGPTGANPVYIVVNTPTAVLFNSQIPDPELKKRSVILVRLDGLGAPSELLGRLHDDGRNGDARANDSIYSLLATLNEPTVGSANFVVAARFKPSSSFEPESDDDDWDGELSRLKQTGRDEPARHQLLLKLLNRLGSYQLSAPIQVTIDPFQLPPHPGATGEQTLEGIDSDNDGVRDDVQRYIGLTYQTSPSERAAFTQYGTALQNYMKDEPQPGALADLIDLFAATNCIASVMGADSASSTVAALDAVALNTDARFKAYLASWQFVHDLPPPPVASEPNSSCTASTIRN
jgi:hypothetical protein